MEEISPIKERILIYLEKTGVKKVVFCETTGISYANLKGKGLKSEIGGQQIGKILSIYRELSAEWLLTGLGEMLKLKQGYKEEPIPVLGVAEPMEIHGGGGGRYDNQQIPLYELSAQAGVVGLFVDAASQTPVDYISIPNLSKCDGAVHVRGDSMYPILKSGDIVLYKKVNNIFTGISYGDMYIVDCDVDGDTIIAIKYVQRGDSPEMVRLASYNQHYSSVDVPIESIRSLAIVKASIRYNTMG